MMENLINVKNLTREILLLDHFQNTLTPVSFHEGGLALHDFQFWLIL